MNGSERGTLSQQPGWLISGLLGPFGAVRGPDRSGAPRRVVLLVQVAPDLEAGLVKAIRHRGHHVLLAASVAEALTILKATIPDLVVLGTATLEMGLLVSSVERSYSRGMRPQLVTNAERPLSGQLPSWLALLE